MVTNSVLQTKIENLEKVIKIALEGFAKVYDLQNELIRSLRQDNRDLLNRIMARNMPEYHQLSPASVAEMDVPAEALAREDNFSQEFLAGETVDET